ncbi:MAG: hypothetical protein QOG04_916 [Actinomycetota bacterium]|jgi:hypothetical protein|nr:hypothetical protein [Actinomycetota bacterium]
MAVFLLAMVLTALLAPAASAQIGGIGDAVGGVTDPITGGGSSGGGADTGGGSSSGGGIIGDITDPIAGGDPGGSGGSGSGDPITDITDGVKDTVDHSKDKAEETAGQVGGSLGVVVGGAKEAVDRVTSGLKGHSGKKKDNKTNNPKDRTHSTSPSVSQDNTDVLGETLAAALAADAKSVSDAKATGRDFTATATTSNERSFISSIGDIATEAAQQAVFPALLTLMVIAFLMVQNRIDRRDPKLALAPVDSEHDLLSFT